MNRLKFLLIAITVISASCSSKHNQQNEVTQAFINTAFKNVNIPFDDYKIDAEFGDTIFYNSGSILIFPPNSFVDKKGNVVKGEVNVRYREFSNPLDFFIAGIPMNYDSCGIQYMFESSGMCEVNAFQNDNPVFVNQKSKPQISIVTNNIDTKHNLYYLDTIQKKWITKGKNRIFNFIKKATDHITSVNKTPLVEPIEPLKETSDRPFFNITIEPGSVSELEAYNHLKFEVAKEDKNYDPKYGSIVWDNVKVERGSIKGTYLVTFTKGKLTISFLTRPVFDGKYYEEAIQLYKKKKKEYEKAIAEQRRLVEQQNLQNKKTMNQFDSLNQVIKIRNKQIEKLNQNTIADNERQLNLMKNLLNEMNPNSKEYKKKLKEIRLQEFEIQKAKALQKIKQRYVDGGVLMYNDIYRTFSIDGFGVWNSDCPIMLSGKGAIKIKARFIDENNRKLNFNMVQVVYKGINGINANHNSAPENCNPDLDVIPNSENMIWAVLNNHLYYLTYEDFMKYNISNQTKEQTFKMRCKTDSITSVEDIKRLIKMDMQ